MIFENFIYKFRGKLYRQGSGGPIGARVAMAASRLVLIDWGEDYSSALRRSRMEIGLLSGYVDDIRQGGTSIRLGLRYGQDDKWTWREEDYKEDLE